LQHIDQFALGVGLLEVQSAQDAFLREREVILHKSLRYPRCGISRLIPDFNEESALVAEDLGFDDHDSGQAGIVDLHRHSVFWLCC
jgi:hypothetical protein